MAIAARMAQADERYFLSLVTEFKNEKAVKKNLPSFIAWATRTHRLDDYLQEVVEFVQLGIATSAAEEWARSMGADFDKASKAVETMRRA